MILQVHDELIFDLVEEEKERVEKIVKDIKSALSKNQLEENTYVYKASYEKLDFNTIETVSLNVEKELTDFLANERINHKIYLYKIKLPKGTNFVAFSNIIFFDNKKPICHHNIPVFC